MKDKPEAIALPARRPGGKIAISSPEMQWDCASAAQIAILL